jgi:hypothetical protein
MKEPGSSYWEPGVFLPLYYPTRWGEGVVSVQARYGELPFIGGEADLHIGEVGPQIGAC